LRAQRYVSLAWVLAKHPMEVTFQSTRKPIAERPRLIVEFAVENKAKVKKLEESRQRAQQRARKSVEGEKKPQPDDGALSGEGVDEENAADEGYASNHDEVDGDGDGDGSNSGGVGFGKIARETKKRQWSKSIADTKRSKEERNEKQAKTKEAATAPPKVLGFGTILTETIGAIKRAADKSELFKKKVKPAKKAKAAPAE
jgi:hypothetical protein